VVALEIAKIAEPLVDDSAVEYGHLARLPSAQFSLLLNPTFVVCADEATLLTHRLKQCKERLSFTDRGHFALASRNKVGTRLTRQILRTQG
jgi:hypothetical protein